MSENRNSHLYEQVHLYKHCTWCYYENTPTEYITPALRRTMYAHGYPLHPPFLSGCISALFFNKPLQLTMEFERLSQKQSMSAVFKSDQLMKKIAYVGIDYHMNVVALAVIIAGEKEFYDTIRLKNSC